MSIHSIPLEGNFCLLKLNMTIKFGIYFSILKMNRSFIQVALREEASKALEELDRSKTCPCGITFPVFTHAEYVAYNRHLCKFHRDLDKFKPFLCPVPGCNIRRTSQTCLDKHVEDSHGEMHVCRHCGKKFRQKKIKTHTRPLSKFHFDSFNRASARAI